MLLFVFTPLQEASRQLLKNGLPADFELVFRADVSEDEQRSALNRADFILGNPPAAWLEAGLPNLKWWQLDSAGFDAYRGVTVSCPVTNMGDFFAWPCAETIVGGVLALYRKLNELAVLQSQSRWVGAALRPSMQLMRGKKVVILGAGTIGQVTRQLLTAFECPIQTLARTNPEAELHSVEELKAVLPQTDVVISTLPGSAQGFFTAELIAAMQPGSVFANVGRGSTVDEPALIEALQNGHLGGAVLDVTATEPLPADSPLWTLPNVILTQHTGGGQAGEESGKVELFLQNLTRLQQGEPPLNRVELAQGY